MSAPVEPGTILAGKFRVDRVLGQGGMGIVVAARHLTLDEDVAIKFLLPTALSNPETVARFAQEARAAVKIKSEHVARVSDVGTLENGAPYMVMEHLVGNDLGTVVLLRGRLSVADALDYVLQASEAVAEAHALGIVHRDLKPANLFLVHRADGSPCVKVLDFGISKMVGPGGMPVNTGLTQSAIAMGSPNYMSPEQLTSTRDVDARTDIYALGAILYELLSGRPPFLAASFAELCSKVLTTRPESLHELNPSVPAELEAVVLSALERDRDRRIPDISELAQALLPFAPLHSRLSAERIERTLRAAGLSGTKRTFPGSESSHGQGQRTQSFPPPASIPGSTSGAAFVATVPGSGEPPASSTLPGGSMPGAAPLPPVPAYQGTMELPADALPTGDARSQTMTGLGQTISGKRRTPRWVFALGAAVLAMSALVATRVRSPAPPAPLPTAEAVTAAPPSTEVVAVTSAALPVEPAPSVAPVDPPAVMPTASAVAAPPSRPVPVAVRTKKALPAPAASTAPAKKPNCDPNFWLDSLGEKHFKPECF